MRFPKITLTSAAALALTQAWAAAASLSINNVTQRDVDCSFDRGCSVLGVSLSSDNLQFYMHGNGAQITTRTRVGGAGSFAAGRTGYQFRIDLTAANLNGECIRGMVFGFQPIDTIVYGGSASQVYVITSGAPGTVAPTSVRTITSNLVEIEFGRPLCPGESSYEIGMSTSMGTPTRAPVWLLIAGPVPIMQTTARVP
ncbi:MAG: hypothetical protein HY244_13740 [Rhizobiales bacterium]|nr:hypothetical protein [Hyphomicrobiales bacterium]